MSIKKDEEIGRDRGFEFETDDEGNEGHHQPDGSDYCRSSSSSSSSYSQHSHDHENYYGEPLEPYQTTWPQSYRQSIDVYSNVPSAAKVGFLAGSSLVSASSAFLKPFLHDDSDTHAHGLPPPSPSSSPLGRPSFLVTPPHTPHYQPGTPTAPLLGGHSHSPSFQFAPPSRAGGSSLRFASYCDLPPPQLCSTSQSVVNGINVLCGVGLLTTPYAIKEGGWLGMLLLAALGVISCYTGVLLKKCLDSSPGIKTYPDIGQAAFGFAGRFFISIVLYLELYGSCVEYITLVSNSLSLMFPKANLSFMGTSMSSHQLFAVSTAIAVLPTVCLKNLSLLSYLSAAGVFATILVVICLFWVGVVDDVGFHPAGTALDLVNLPVALGLYGFCYSGHAVFPNIYSSMRKPGHFPLVLIICFLLCTTLYAGVAATGFLMFGESIESQFTLNMPQQYFSSKVAVWTTVINPLSKYALTMNPVALSLEELLPSSQQSHFIMLLIRTGLVLSTLFVALTVPFFGFVMALLGSVCTMLVALILPCGCYLKIQQRSVKMLEIIICIAVILIGATCSGIGSYSSIKQIIDNKS